MDRAKSNDRDSPSLAVAMPRTAIRQNRNVELIADRRDVKMFYPLKLVWAHRRLIKCRNILNGLNEVRRTRSKSSSECDHVKRKLRRVSPIVESSVTLTPCYHSLDRIAHPSIFLSQGEARRLCVSFESRFKSSANGENSACGVRKAVARPSFCQRLCVLVANGKRYIDVAHIYERSIDLVNPGRCAVCDFFMMQSCSDSALCQCIPITIYGVCAQCTTSA